ncbi:L-lactate dehydrogenase [uncultured Clostridium sp.]|uniref:L-lactate dehydrogenase n=1 Tax=uncultured Clostridium sp. TaxID=59620 RepID=UPI0028EC743F|nr:L-lactate dehydrogenase [uncultured Clostridium sp.]
MNKKGIKISIIGAGFVGATTAYAIMMEGLASEIVIVDIDKEKAKGEAMDLAHGVSFLKPVDVISGDYKDTKGSDIVIITAGMGPKPGETRLDLINKNYKVFKSIVPPVVEYSPNCIITVVSNPVDVLTYVTYKLSGFPPERVIGSGTVLDTSRFKYLLSDHFNVDARNIHSYILGEHGDSEIAAWSLTNIAGIDVDEYCKKFCGKCEGDFKKNIYEDVKNAAYEVLNRKGNTSYAIALAVRRIVEAIIRDEDSILTVSTLLKGEFGINNIYMGVPCVVGEGGVKRVLEVKLNKEELDELKRSAEVLNESLKEINY